MHRSCVPAQHCLKIHEHERIDISTWSVCIQRKATGIYVQHGEKAFLSYNGIYEARFWAVMLGYKNSDFTTLTRDFHRSFHCLAAFEVED